MKKVFDPKTATIFTTGQVAKICKVAARTVSDWFDSAMLRGYRIPGSRVRRIPRENLIAFLKEHGMPLGVLEEDAELTRILIIGSIQDFSQSVLSSQAFKVEIVSTMFEAGLAARSFQPHCVIIDFVAMGVTEALQIADWLASDAESKNVVRIGLLTEKDQRDGWDLGVLTTIIQQPIEALALGLRIAEIIEVSKRTSAVAA